jgi:glycosyltransferase involved in cell wall biosynthesis
MRDHAYIYDKFGFEYEFWKFYKDMFRITTEIANQIWEDKKDYFNKFDYIVTSDTAPISRIFMENINNLKPRVIVWICNRFDYNMEGDTSYYDIFKRISLENKNKFTFIPSTDFESIWCKLNGISNISDTITPIGINNKKLEYKIDGLESLIDKYVNDGNAKDKFNDSNELRDKIVISIYNNDNLFFNLKEIMLQNNIDCFNGGYKHPSDLKQCIGMIYFPDAYLKWSAFETIQNQVIVFLPSPSFFIKLQTQINNDRYYQFVSPNIPLNIDLCVWYKYKECRIYFDSIDDMIYKIKSLTPELIEEKRDWCKKYGEQIEKENIKKWSDIFNIDTEVIKIESNYLLYPKKSDMEDISCIVKETTKIRLHLLGLPHTITDDSFSHCAFTGKILRFSKMMQSRGYEVYHYGIETSKSGADKQINLLSKKEWELKRIESYQWLHPEMSVDDVRRKLNNETSFIGDLGNWDSPLYILFNDRLRKTLPKYYRSTTTDIVCITFGPSHNRALDGLNILKVETGIGYSNAFHEFRIYESYSKLFVDLNHTELRNYWFVIPNYYDTEEFVLSITPQKQKIGFLGRIDGSKGCYIISEVAKHFPSVEFVLCGQGDPEPFLTSSNIKYQPPITGKDRSDYLGSLTALIAPSKYSEPFCGVSVEAQLCGTPVITHPYGALIDTVENLKTGVHCRTLGDFCYAVQMALDGKFDREYIRDRAKQKYDMYEVAKQYDCTFKTILDLYNGKGGWYSKESYLSYLEPTSSTK